MKFMKILGVILFVSVQVTLARIMVEMPETGFSIAEERAADPADRKVEAAAVKPFETEKIFGPEYFPMDANVGFRFSSNAGETIATLEKAGKGVAVSYDAPNFTYKQTLFKTDKGVFLTRTETHAFLFFGNDISYPEPVLRIPLPLKAGDAWQWEGLEVEDEDTTKLTISGKALGEEQIELAGQKFSCLRIELQVSSENGSRNTVNEWFAPGLGLVKSHAKLEGSGITYILQKIMGLDEITFELEAYGDLASMED
jgi:hypothetical protein